MPRPSVTTARSSLSGSGSKLSASISPISPRILPIHCSYRRGPVLEVEAGPLHEVGDPGLDLGRVGDPDRGQVGVAVEHPEVDPEGRRDQVVAGVVLRQRGQGELVEGGVPGAHDLRPVDPVLEPEHRVLVLAPVGRERQRVGVQLLPPLGPRGGLDLEGAREPVRHGPVLSVEARVRARAGPKLHVRAAATRGWPRCWPSGRRRWRPAWPPSGSRPSPAGPGAGSRPARRAGRRQGPTPRPGGSGSAARPGGPGGPPP